MFKYLITGATALVLMVGNAIAYDSNDYSEWANTIAQETYTEFQSDYNKYLVKNNSTVGVGDYWSHIWWPANDPDANKLVIPDGATLQSLFDDDANKWFTSLTNHEAGKVALNQDLYNPTDVETYFNSLTDYVVLDDVILTTNYGTGTPDKNTYDNLTHSSYEQTHYSDYKYNTVTTSVSLGTDIKDAHQDGWTGKGFTIKGEKEGWAYSVGFNHVPTYKYGQVAKHISLKDLHDYLKLDPTHDDYVSYDYHRKKAKYHDNQKRKVEAKVGKISSAVINIYNAKDIAPSATFVDPEPNTYTAKLYKTGDASNFVTFDMADHNGSAQSKRAVRSFNADEAAKGALVWHKFSNLSKTGFEQLINATTETVNVSNGYTPTFFENDEVQMINLSKALSPIGNVN